MEATTKSHSRFGVASMVTFVVTVCLLVWLVSHGQSLSTGMSSYTSANGSLVREYNVSVSVVLVIVGSQLGVGLGIAGFRRTDRKTVFSLIGLIGNSILLLMSLSIILCLVTK